MDDERGAWISHAIRHTQLLRGSAREATRRHPADQAPRPSQLSVNRGTRPNVVESTTTSGPYRTAFTPEDPGRVRPSPDSVGIKTMGRGRCSVGRQGPRDQAASRDHPQVPHQPDHPWRLDHSTGPRQRRSSLRTMCASRMRKVCFDRPRPSRNRPEVEPSAAPVVKLAGSLIRRLVAIPGVVVDPTAANG